MNDPGIRKGDESSSFLATILVKMVAVVYDNRLLPCVAQVL